MSRFQGGRELSTFPLAPSVLSKLITAGLLTVDEIQGMKPSELSKEANVTPSEALEILETVFEDVSANIKKVSTPQAKTAWEILQEEHNSPAVVTFCESLDDMIGGGIPLSKITEFCGAPGIGKTQMCLQLAVDVQIPACVGGVEGEVVYIDTEGSFIIERLVDIATATLEHCQAIGNEGDCNSAPNLSGFTLEKILSSIHYYRVHDYVELLAVVHLLPRFFQENPKVKLLVVDSIACPFRHGFEDMSVRTRVLSTLTQSFIRLATQFKCAVVLTNQMTTKITSSSSHLAPALGESWGHASTIRIILFWEGNQRKALLYKSPSRQETVCVYQVTPGGIRDVVLEGTKKTRVKREMQEEQAQTAVVNNIPTSTRNVDNFELCHQQPAKKPKTS